MAVIKLGTFINAPVAVCFDLSRSIDVHIKSTQHTGETAVAGRTTGLIELNESVTWRARHFGLWQTLKVQITAMHKPDFFADEMVAGAFKSFRHEHYFNADHHGTMMHDVFTFESPGGWLGKLANHLFLTRYMTKLLITRNATIKNLAESDQWQSFV